MSTNQTYKMTTNEMIARRVMGLKRRPETARRAIGKNEYDVVFENKVLLGTSFVFDPEHSRADAFEVLKKCAEKLGYTPTFRTDSRGWSELRGGDMPEAFPTLQLAICAFALKLFPE